eukprot:6269114-Karenia_brevis.AAC.1
MARAKGIIFTDTLVRLAQISYDGPKEEPSIYWNIPNAERGCFETEKRTEIKAELAAAVDSSKADGIPCSV